MGKYIHPIYKPPHNIKHIKGRSSISHAAINKGALHGKNLEIAYVDNKARLFFMHIQGSSWTIWECLILSLYYFKLIDDIEHFHII